MPTALAQDCVGTPDAHVCAIEQNGKWGSCDSFGLYFGETRVIVNTPAASATAVGQGACLNFFGNEYASSRVAAAASAADHFVAFDWGGYDSTSGSACWTIVSTSATDPSDLGCPAGRPPGPPTVMWGSLLP